MVKAKLYLFYRHNLKRSGRSDMHMLHGGCPVIVGKLIFKIIKKTMYFRHHNIEIYAKGFLKLDFRFWSNDCPLAEPCVKSN